jgi:hypothetical protein
MIPKLLMGIGLSCALLGCNNLTGPSKCEVTSKRFEYKTVIVNPDNTLTFLTIIKPEVKTCG